MLYELVCGYNPFSADSIAATLRRVAESEPELPSLLDPTIPPGFDSFLRKLHAKDRNARFASADAASRAARAIFEKENVARPGVLFREFLQDPSAFVAARNRRLAEESAADAERLLKDASAPPEEALWAAYRTVACLPHDAHAQELFKNAAIRAGQREKPLENAKIRGLEEALRKEPDNIALLLQLAKLYRLEHDFVNLMRFFRKLSALAPPDPYTQGQIASLLAADTGPAYATRAVPAAVPASPRTVPAAPPARRGSPLEIAGITAVVLAIAALGIWWARRAPRLPEVAPLHAGAAPALAVPPPGTPSQEPLPRLLERGQAIEKESGADKAWDFYAEAAGKAPRAETRAALYRTMIEVAQKSGDPERVLKSLDGLASVPGARGEALVKRGEFLESAGRQVDAERTWEEALRLGDPAAASAAALRLAQAAERGKDALRAQTLYEGILRESTGAPEALPARLGLAALYRAAGRASEARRLYEDLVRLAPPGGEFARAAEAALREMDGMAPAAAEAKP